MSIIFARTTRKSPFASPLYHRVRTLATIFFQSIAKNPCIWYTNSITERKIKGEVTPLKQQTITATLGALLHDIGKLAHRAGESGTHSASGVRVLRERVPDREILDCVAYHHESALRHARLAADSPAYIVNLADSISAAADRREEEGEEGSASRFDRYCALESIFNHLLNHHAEGRLRARGLDGALRFPEPGLRNEAADYKTILRELLEGIGALRMEEEWIPSLLALLEAWTSSVPSSTARDERADISLFDHAKIAAAVAACISEYLLCAGRCDLRGELLERAAAFRAENAFLLFSADLSGIQSFLYTVTTSEALRSLRSRSFYLEMLMEHVIDEVLAACSLSRVNLLYSGGGHCYLLLPNTEETRQGIETVMRCVRRELIRQFGLRLYLAYAFVPCSANDLVNHPAEKAPYPGLYRQLSEALSRQKMHRYSAEEIRLLNEQPAGEDGRECKICGRADLLTGNLCQWCDRFTRLSAPIQNCDVFYLSGQADASALPLPSPKGTLYLRFSDEQTVRAALARGEDVRRVYTKNRRYTGLRFATHLHVGDYHASNLMSDLADQATGIRRLAVCRADVDSLGAAIIAGFERSSEDPVQRNRYATLSRTATLSRQLSLFFKFHINQLLGGIPGEADMQEALPVSIVYSGGDDVFLVGAWDGVLQAMRRIRSAFARFTSGNLSISAGIGLYGETFPIRRAAALTEELVEETKGMEGKNALALFVPHQGHAYRWTDFEARVLGEKYACVKRFFENQFRTDGDERGMAFLYRLLALLRSSGEQINVARFAYLLARMEPSGRQAAARQQYLTFSHNMMTWYRQPEDRGQLITAIYLYIYEKRGN